MLTEKAKQARREYKRQWQRNNPEKVKAQQERYWTRRAAEADRYQQTQKPVPQGEG